MSSQTSIFKRPMWVVIFALTAAVAWGWAYPLIKIGFNEFGITSYMTGSKILFAGIRFFISGIIILIIARIANCKFTIRKNIDLLYILVFSLMNTALHYAFFYIGLSHSQGARASILNSLGTFILVILACLFFKSDKLTSKKIIGCIVGFCGVLALNFGDTLSGSFTIMGDGMIILNALCSAVAGLMTRGLGRRVDIFVGTGYSLTIGGILLIIPGVLMGGVLPNISLYGIIILGLLITISSLGFTLYNKLLSCNPVGKVAIFNSFIPVVGVLTSCLCLSEPFYFNYIIAAILSATGIYIINRAK
ncbi:MAG: DMT family transporter [Bacteroidales bacterium]|nr:DMT family transporter [Bacteroidales bacterium]